MNHASAPAWGTRVKETVLSKYGIIVEFSHVDFSKKHVICANCNAAESVIRDHLHRISDPMDREKVRLIVDDVSSTGKLYPLVEAAREGGLSQWVKCSSCLPIVE